MIHVGSGMAAAAQVHEEEQSNKQGSPVYKEQKTGKPRLLSEEDIRLEPTCININTDASASMLYFLNPCFTCAKPQSIELCLRIPIRVEDANL